MSIITNQWMDHLKVLDFELHCLIMDSCWNLMYLLLILPGDGNSLESSLIEEPSNLSWKTIFVASLLILLLLTFLIYLTHQRLATFLSWLLSPFLKTNLLIKIFRKTNFSFQNVLVDHHRIFICKWVNASIHFVC